MLRLGGAGYNFANTTRYWTYFTSIPGVKVLDGDILDKTQFIELYGLINELNVNAGNEMDYM